MMTVDHLVDSASVGWWWQRETDGPREKAQSCFGKEERSCGRRRGSRK